MKNSFNTLFTFSIERLGASVVLVALLWGCLPNDKVPAVKSDDSIGLVNKYSNYCKGSALTNSPFANSTESPSGTSKTDPYLICTAEQFNRIGTSSNYWDRYFLIGANLNFVRIPFSGFNTLGTASTPFTGTIDGGKYSIINMTFLGGASDDVGLIAYLGTGGVVKDLKILNALVTGANNLGLIAANNQGGTISNVEVSAVALTGTNKIGGIVGYMTYGKIENSKVVFVASGIPTGSNQIGGIVGENTYGAIVNTSLELTSMSGGEDVGGAVGKSAGGYLHNVSVKIYGTIQGNTDFGGLVGDNNGDIFNSSVTIESITATAGNSNVGGLLGLNTNGDVLSSSATITTITAATNVGGLIGKNVNGDVNESWASIGSIVGGSTGTKIGGLIGYNYPGGDVSDSYASVTGSITGGSSHIAGFIGYNYSGEIADSYVNYKDVTGQMNVAGFIGENYSGIVVDCYSLSSGTLTGTGAGSGSGSVGGFIAVNNLGVISSSYASTNTITSASNFVGGFIGKNGSGTTIQTSYASVGGSLSGSGYIGGFIGNNDGNIFRSYAETSSIVSSADNVGGFVGKNSAKTISNSYSENTTKIEGTGSSVNIGGFAGVVSGTTIFNTYAISKLVKGAGENVAGHTANISTSIIKDSFAIATDVIGNSTPVGDDIPSVGKFLGDVDCTYNTDTSEYDCLTTRSNLYINSMDVCTNSGSGQCHEEFLSSDKFVEETHDPVPFTCDTTIETCNCTPAPGQDTCEDVEEGYFQVSTNPPMNVWDFSYFWEDQHGKSPGLR